MDTSKLKRFAPECREQLMEQVGVKLDYVLTTRTPDLAEQENLVKALQKAIDSEGRDAVIERVAYTWFNRLAALRYLDARGWHPFRMRVLTPANEDETQPELLRQVRQGVIPDELQDFVSANRVNDLLDGKLPSDNPQAEVQRLLVIGVCQYYAELLPDLFERLDDFSQILLPDDLLTEHSMVHGFQTEISDEDCAEVEVLGWLYQFYISEKKDAVMARKKTVPSEDIPAVTQLFTPHWIVRYLVENSLGRLWLRSKPDSRLREHMPYYVEDPEGQEPADSLTVATPEEIKLLDPACGSGHMLTYAFDLLVKIYEEEGHTPSEIPEKILTHNLFGLEICPRAAQLAQFALVCKAREQSRAAFRRPVQPQVMCLRDIVITADEMQAWSEATGVTLSQDELSQVHQFRENTQTFGALIQPVLDVEGLAALREKIGEDAASGDLLVQSTHRKLRLVLDQAEMLSQRYQVVVANPPYMGRGAMELNLKEFIEDYYPGAEPDLYAAFMGKAELLALRRGFFAMITMQSWMFLSGFQDLRSRLMRTRELHSLLQLGPRAFDELSGEVVQVAAFVYQSNKRESNLSKFFDLSVGNNSREKEILFLDEKNSDDSQLSYAVSVDEFLDIPLSPFVYSVSKNLRRALALPPAGDSLVSEGAVKTGNNARFIRFVWEIEGSEVASDGPWRLHPKGGDNRRWYGNLDSVVLWTRSARDHYRSDRIARIPTSDIWDLKGISWSSIASGTLGFRLVAEREICNNAALFVYPSNQDQLNDLIGCLNSTVSRFILSVISPTLNALVGDVMRIPVPRTTPSRVSEIVDILIEASRADWNNFETSWDFRDLPLLRSGNWEIIPNQPGGPWKGRTLAESWANYAAYCTAAIRRMQELETENNRLWIDAYGLQDELDPAVPEDEITLARADEKTDMIAFVSYAVGCMMGRYSLDHPGLILADAGDTLEPYFEKVGKSADEVTFLPDDDAIIPITEDDWFEDDAASRVREFLRVTFGKESLEENVAFLEESLGKDLRKYFTANTGGFYADHVKTYKKRPIYWLFESPKKHFRALVYLHRYTRDTVNTLLNGYLREFHHKLTARIGDLQHTIDSASTSAGDKTRAQKALDKAQAALRDVEEYERDILLPLAPQRLKIDLDDGVKTNYPKFGKALAKVSGLS
jgi:hypothetical protein